MRDAIIGEVKEAIMKQTDYEKDKNLTFNTILKNGDKKVYKIMTKKFTIFESVKRLKLCEIMNKTDDIFLALILTHDEALKKMITEIVEEKIPWLQRLVAWRLSLKRISWLGDHGFVPKP
eukprot:UN05636